MKHAEILRLSVRNGPHPSPWLVGITDYDADDPGYSASTWHPTHADALAHALEQVGLATPPEHRKAP